MPHEEADASEKVNTLYTEIHRPSQSVTDRHSPFIAFLHAHMMCHLYSSPSHDVPSLFPHPHLMCQFALFTYTRGPILPPSHLLDVPSYPHHHHKMCHPVLPLSPSLDVPSYPHHRHMMCHLIPSTLTRCAILSPPPSQAVIFCPLHPHKM